MTGPIVGRFRSFKLPEHVHPFVLFVFSRMNAQRVNALPMAEQAGFSVYTLHHWRYAQSPRLDNLEAALNVLGYRLAIVPKDSPTPTIPEEK